jgi:hypothetical protein
MPDRRTAFGQKTDTAARRAIAQLAENLGLTWKTAGSRTTGPAALLHRPLERRFD